MKRGVLYARVSSEQQKNEKTIESQLAELRETCKRDKVKIVEEYIDDGWSGSTLARQGLDKLRDDAKKGVWDILYIYSADRLARNHIDQGIVLRELKKEGIQVVFRDRPLTEDNKLQTDIESLLAEYERKQFIERTRRGKLHKAKSGKIIHCKPPFGYKFMKSEKGEWSLEINKDEEKIVRLIFDLFFQYQSSHRIAKELFEKKIFTRANCIWRSARISELLQNETYIGNWHYNRTERIEAKVRKKKFYKRVKTSRTVKDKRDWITLKVPAIIDKETFERVQELRRKNFKLYGKTKYTYLLGGLLWCAKCGSRMVGFAHRHRWFYYRCSQRTKTFPKSYTCKATTINKEDLENLVWNKVKEALQNPKILLQYVSYLKNGDKDVELLKAEKEDFLKKKEQIKKKRDKLFELYELENIGKEELSERIGDNTQAEKEIDRSIKEIEARLKQIGNKQLVVNRLKEFSKLSRKQLNNLTPQQKKDFLKIIIKKVACDTETKKVEIVGHIPILDTSKEENQRLMSLPVETLLSSSARPHGGSY